MTGKEMVIGIQQSDVDLIEEAESGILEKEKQGSGRRKMLFLAAALIALMLVGCAAAVLLHLENLRLGERPYIKNMHYREDGSTFPATEKSGSIFRLPAPKEVRTRLLHGNGLILSRAMTRMAGFPLRTALKRQESTMIIRMLTHRKCCTRLMKFAGNIL